MLSKKKCTICFSPTREILDLGLSPIANNFISSLEEKQRLFPLVLEYCNECSCLQLKDCLSETELYNEYTYLTPQTESINSHYEVLYNYMKDKNLIDSNTNCLEIGSNSGDFLSYLKPRVKSVIGVDPAKNVAKIANLRNIKTLNTFFSEDFVKTNKESLNKINLIIARHMFAHNSDPTMILSGINLLLEQKGTVLIENAYAFDTLRNGEFDQIYHEHMFYYSAKSMNALLNIFSFELKDIFFSKLHGGSAIFICGRINSGKVSSKVINQIDSETEELEDDKIFKKFKRKININRKKTLDELKKDLLEARTIGAYGASAKAFTLFSFYDLDVSTIKFCVDTTPTKIGKIFPKFNIPIISEEELQKKHYDTILVTAWNYKDDILSKSKSLFKEGTKLIFPLPQFDTYIV